MEVILPSLHGDEWNGRLTYLISSARGGMMIARAGRRVAEWLRTLSGIMVAERVLFKKTFHDETLCIPL
jgi:hypothetical protein